MISKPEIHHLNKNLSMTLERIEGTIKRSGKENLWRCLYIEFPGNSKDDALKQKTYILSNLLKDYIVEIDEIKIVWYQPKFLGSDHLFVFFRGPVTHFINSFKNFVNNVLYQGNSIAPSPQYQFFWHIQKFWGNYETHLKHKLEVSPSSSEIILSGIHNNKQSDMNIFSIKPELKRERSRRYKPLLMIVEDDRTSLRILKGIMQPYCDIIATQNLSEAQNIYSESAPNMVFLDIELPDGNGIDFAEDVCNQDPDSFVVITSGTISPSAISQCQSVGVKGFVAKPLNQERLFQFINLYHAKENKKSA